MQVSDCACSLLYLLTIWCDVGFSKPEVTAGWTYMLSQPKFPIEPFQSLYPEIPKTETLKDPDLWRTSTKFSPFHKEVEFAVAQVQRSFQVELYSCIFGRLRAPKCTQICRAWISFQSVRILLFCYKRTNEDMITILCFIILFCNRTNLLILNAIDVFHNTCNRSKYIEVFIKHTIQYIDKNQSEIANAQDYTQDISNNRQFIVIWSPGAQKRGIKWSQNYDISVQQAWQGNSQSKHSDCNWLAFLQRTKLVSWNPITTFVIQNFPFQIQGKV